MIVSPFVGIAIMRNTIRTLCCVPGADLTFWPGVADSTQHSSVRNISPRPTIPAAGS